MAKRWNTIDFNNLRRLSADPVAIFIDPLATTIANDRLKGADAWL